LTQVLGVDGLHPANESRLGTTKATAGSAEASPTIDRE
jgi:hypothetical protein